jgi:hypothetical protein
MASDSLPLHFMSPTAFFACSLVGTYTDKPQSRKDTYREPRTERTTACRVR